MRSSVRVRGLDGMRCTLGKKVGSTVLTDETDLVHKFPHISIYQCS